jgi:pimeloyl-ACP methyl ester carboxylesterase
MNQSNSDIKFLNHPDGRLAYRDEGVGETIVYVHGTPTSSLEYVGLIDRLKDSYRCLAIDHLGFGCSDKPKDADYSIEAHTSRLRSLLSQLSIKSFHLVVHDFGGVIGLPLAREKTFSIRSLTIMNSWAWPLIESEPHMRSQLWILRSRLMDWLYLYMNFSPKVLLKMAWGKHSPITKQKRKAYQDAFRSPSERYGLLSFKNTLLNFDHPCWHSKDLSNLASMPILLAWGMSDSLISSRNLDRWIKMFPDARVSRFEKVGHFVADEGEELLAPELRKFLQHAREIGSS